MTRDDVLRMAQEAKFPVNHPDWADAAERFAALVRSSALEEAAKVCDWERDNWDEDRPLPAEVAVRAEFLK